MSDPSRQTRIDLIAYQIILGRTEQVPEDATSAEVEAALALANRLRWTELQMEEVR